ncbi:MAG: hypothetical protein DRI28_00275 [Caldiserica bacterium]|nr:MAG: hypothetical protein DRI28_00275 [Caldisericota bacterium]
MPFGKTVKQEFQGESGQSYIGEGTSVDGKIVAQGNLRIDGKVKGEIDCKGTVTVGEKGNVEANIKASTLIAMGTVIGNVHVKERVEILNTGKIEGDVETPKIAIEEGGILDGKCNMLEKQKVVPTSQKIAKGKSEVQK